VYVLQDTLCISGLGFVVFYVANMFAEIKCYVSTGLAYVSFVARFNYQLL